MSRVKYTLTVKSLTLLLVQNGFKEARVVQSQVSDVNMLEIRHENISYMEKLLDKMKTIRPEFANRTIRTFKSRHTIHRIIIYPSKL